MQRNTHPEVGKAIENENRKEQLALKRQKKGNGGWASSQNEGGEKTNQKKGA